MGIPYAEVIGDPISHSKSPLIHGFWLDKLGMEEDYRAVRMAGEDLQDYLRARRKDPDWRGCNLTLPHKRAAMEFVDVVEDHGIGAINCILPRNGSLVGRNTDTAGIEEAVPGAVDTDQSICVIGAGGAARAAVASLLSVHQFNIVVRESIRGQALLKDLNKAGAVFDFQAAHHALAGCSGVINASPLGMRGFPEMPEAVLGGLSKLRRRGFAFDMVYDPVRTAFLQAADSAGLESIDGVTMLIGQAAEAFQLFFGAAAPRSHDARLRALLAA